jgi:hypothetical protein
VRFGNCTRNTGVTSGMQVRLSSIERHAAHALFLLALFVLCACAPHRVSAPENWRFDVASQPDRLLPPVAVQPVKRVYRIPIDGLRLGHEGCRLESDAFSLLPVRGALELRFADALTNGAQRSIDAVEQLRQDALRLEDNGCLGAGGGMHVIQSLVEALPLSSRGAFGMRYGAYELKGAVTLEPGFRLKVVAPLLKAGYSEIKATLEPNSKPGQLEVNVEGLEGFETAYHDVRARPGGGVEFALTSVEQNRLGKLTHPAAPTAFNFDIAPDIRSFRLLFLRRLSIADRDISLLGGASWGVLLASTQRFDTVPGSVSECMTTPGLQCVAVTAKTAILSEVGVTVNGRPAFVPIGGNLAELLNNFGFETQQQQDAALANLKIERLWHGKHHPIAIDVKDTHTFGLVLFPGDRVSW